MAKSGTETLPENTVVVEDAGPSRKRLTITIPGAKVADHLDGALATAASEIDLPGFRKGHAPRRLVERRFGKALRDEAKNQLFATAFTEAVEKNELRVLGEPDGAEALAELELEPGTDVTFSLEVEVTPEFDLPALDGIEVKKPRLEVTDEMVDGQLEQIQRNEGELVAQDSSEAGDFCIGAGRILGDGGEELLKIDGAVIQIPTPDKEGKGAILGVFVEDFADQVGLPKPGDTVSVKATGPETHDTPAVRGKDVEIAFEVERVERIKPLEIGDLVARLGVADENQLRESVMLRLNQKLLIDQQAIMRQQVANHLLDNTDLELPEKLTVSQAERNIQRRRMELMYRGVDPTVVEERVAEMQATSGDVAARELKLFFVLEQDRRRDRRRGDPGRGQRARRADGRGAEHAPAAAVRPARQGQPAEPDRPSRCASTRRSTACWPRRL